MMHLPRTRCRPGATNPREVLTVFLGLSKIPARKPQLCRQCKHTYSTTSPKSPKAVFVPSSATEGKSYPTDSWFNTPSTILSSIPRRLHLQHDHPVSITREIIESHFPSPVYAHHNTFHPIVSVHQNFDSLGFPPDHPGRSKTDTYYINESTVLRTHTSAHQADTFRSNASDGFLISADVYRRDAIDRSHYPIFHQMEGARTWDRAATPSNNIAAAALADLANLPKHSIQVEDPNPVVHPERNPLQAEHTAEEVEAVAAHLKRSLELVVIDIFSLAARAAAKSSISSASAGEGEEATEPLRMRWVEAYFPFTSPSWELEVFWQGDWLEVLGCGIISHPILSSSGVGSRVGWAFGIGLDRIAMLLFGIPDIRLFWSTDSRFLDQFKGVSNDPSKIRRFVGFSKHPACYKDVAFWLRGTSAAGGGGGEFHENDVMEIVRGVAGDCVEDVRLTDEFVHPKTGRRSVCYRVNYRSLEKTLTNREANELHEEVRRCLVEKLGVEMR